MAKFKPAKGAKAKKEARTSAWRAIPCLILVVGGMILVSLLMYSMMRSSQ